MQSQSSTSDGVAPKNNENHHHPRAPTKEEGGGGGGDLPFSSFLVGQESGTQTTNDERSSFSTEISDLTATSGTRQRSTAGTLRDSQIIFDSKVMKRSLEQQDDPLARLPLDKVGLVGRETQVQAIQNVYQKAILENKQRKVVTLSGPSGVGKTSLARQALKAVTSLSSSKPCIIAQGKWSLTATDEPLSILRGVMDQIASQICDRHANVKERILKEFESDVEVVTAWMPDLLEGDDENSGQDHSRVKKKRQTSEATVYSITQLRYATTTLLALLDCPLVVMIDDAQWADPTSLELLKCWITDASLQQLFLIVCYRSEEINESHLFVKHFLGPLAEDGTAVEQIPVVPLSVEQTEEFITDLINVSSKKEVSDFSQLLHRSTGGNPFYLVSIIQSLVDETLLSFNLGTMRWTWDLEAIKKAISATDNVVDMVRNKLLHSEKARSLLPIAATLGAEFAENTLMIVCNAVAKEKSIPLSELGLGGLPDPLELHQWLEICETEGFLYHLKSKDAEHTFKFVHDRIQEAALAILSDTKLQNLQYIIGKILAKTVFNNSGIVSSSTPDYMIFTAVNLITPTKREDTTVWDDALSPVQLIRLNLAAGGRAVSKASFHLASEYFETSVRLARDLLLDEKNSCILFAKAHAGAALVAFAAGKPGEMNRYADILISNKKVSLLDKVSTYHIKIQSLLSTEQNEAAISLTVELLEKLGVSFPKGKISTTFSTITGLIRAKGIVRRLKDLDILAKLPIVSDEKEIAIVKSLDVLTSAAYHGKAELIPLAILAIFRRTLKNGLTEYSSVAFALLGLIMASGLEDFESTKSCFELAWAAQKKVASKEMVPRLYFLTYQYVAPWIMPLQNTLRPLDTGYRLGLLGGDIESSAWSRAFHVENAFLIGRPLALVDADCATYSNQLAQYSMLKQKRYVSWSWQAVQNLRDIGGSGSEVSGDIVDYHQEIQYQQNKHDRAMELGLYRVQMFLAVAIGDYKLCADLGLQVVDEACQRLPAQAANIRIRFNAAISGLIMARHDKRKYRRFALKNAAVIRSWTKKGSPNCLHLDAFLDAERARLDNKINSAIKSYESAIVLAGRSGFLQEQALASERYGDMLLGMGWRDQGMNRMQDAIKVYEEWGATAKVRKMEAQYFSP